MSTRSSSVRPTDAASFDAPSVFEDEAAGFEGFVAAIRS
jgi:hypothetical protein